MTSGVHEAIGMLAAARRALLAAIDLVGDASLGGSIPRHDHYAAMQDQLCGIESALGAVIDAARKGEV